jgi:hypothetical protein
MRTEVDFELFPEDCEVVEMPLHNQRVFLIQKNGTSSIRLSLEKTNYKVLVNEEIRSLDSVDVYIRDPLKRYISGVNTYLHHLKRDHPELDYNTAFWFAKRYKFLNRHYLPQFHWLANLSRYLNPDAQISIRDFKNFGSIVDIQSRAGVPPPTDEFVKELLANDPGLELWLFLDQILLELDGKTMSWSELLDHYKSKHYNVLRHVLSTS